MERRAIVIRGIVQGVGFRPFVYHLATRLGLAGLVKNQTGDVLIEVEGEAPALERFIAELTEQPPPLAHVTHLSWETQRPCGDRRFRIESSKSDAASPVFLSPDVAACADCLAEMFDPNDRRYGYPFLNCTNCGPRLTIITGAPYDRQRTTMAAFPMCAACQAEYDDPANRRFHAQPTACAVCGPRLELRDGAGRPIPAPDPLALFAAALLEGKIGALKGLGGYHLTCDARNAQAVAQLRRRKHRDEKPFAVMVADVGSAAALCVLESAERDLLLSPPCPIVLLRKCPLPPTPPLPRKGGGSQTPSPLAGKGRGGGCEIADEVAPGNPRLGVMLPYTPLHHLLLRTVGGVPLVMTSGNRSDEPIAFRDDEALEKLAGIADLFLVHDRPINVRCDDSVTRVVAGVEQPLRRSRGYAPRPIGLPFECAQPILAVGGQLKATFALGRGRQAFLSHHLGDLDHYEAFRAFEKDVALYQQLFAVTPQIIARDPHPDYATSRYAQQLAARTGARLLSVQHHHAHMASCMAEHGLTESVIGVTFDGAGYGTDGAVWGGEVLVGDYQQFRRAAHLRYVGMPGGDQAIREPWRMAIAHLADAGANYAALKARILPTELRVIEKMLERRFNCPLTSSVGRLFDAVASLAGVRDRVSYEGQAAVELEWLAEGTAADGAYPFDLAGDAPLVIDARPLIRAAATDVERGIKSSVIARRFHSTLVDVVAEVCGRVRKATSIETVVFSGGVFMNTLFTREIIARLDAEGFRIYRHQLTPPNDGGLSLGQLAVTAAQSR